jgi:hypothetical protein
MAVESANIVGYYDREADGSAVFAPGFVKVGGGATDLVDLIDTSSLSAFVDHVMIYDPVTGEDIDYLYDGNDGWTADWGTTSISLPLQPGGAYFVEFFSDVTVSGQIADTSLTYTHEIPEGYSYFGSAFPVALQTSNFNFGEVMTPYVDEIQVYDAVNGEDISYLWDGNGFTPDYGSTYLPDVLAPIGQGVMIGNISGFTEIEESLVQVQNSNED